MWWFVAWPLVCLSPSACSDYLHWSAGLPKCEAARAGDVCYRPGQPIEIKK